MVENDEDEGKKRSDHIILLLSKQLSSFKRKMKERNAIFIHSLNESENDFNVKIDKPHFAPHLTNEANPKHCNIKNVWSKVMRSLTFLFLLMNTHDI